MRYQLFIVLLMFRGLEANEDGNEPSSFCPIDNVVAFDARSSAIGNKFVFDGVKAAVADGTMPVGQHMRLGMYRFVEHSVPSFYLTPNSTAQTATNQLNDVNYDLNPPLYGAKADVGTALVYAYEEMFNTSHGMQPKNNNSKCRFLSFFLTGGTQFLKTAAATFEKYYHQDEGTKRHVDSINLKIIGFSDKFTFNTYCEVMDVFGVLNATVPVCNSDERTFAEDYEIYFNESNGINVLDSLNIVRNKSEAVQAISYEYTDCLVACPTTTSTTNTQTEESSITTSMSTITSVSSQTSTTSETFTGSSLKATMTTTTKISTVTTTKLVDGNSTVNPEITTISSSTRAFFETTSGLASESSKTITPSTISSRTSTITGPTTAASTTTTTEATGLSGKNKSENSSAIVVGIVVVVVIIIVGLIFAFVYRQSKRKSIPPLMMNRSFGQQSSRSGGPPDLIQQNIDAFDPNNNQSVYEQPVSYNVDYLLSSAQFGVVPNPLRKFSQRSEGPTETVVDETGYAVAGDGGTYNNGGSTGEQPQYAELGGQYAEVDEATPSRQTEVEVLPNDAQYTSLGEQQYVSTLFPQVQPDNASGHDTNNAEQIPPDQDTTGDIIPTEYGSLDQMHASYKPM